MSALLLASMYGHRKLVKLLLKHGAKVDLEADVSVDNVPRLLQWLINSLQGEERAMCSDVCLCMRWCVLLCMDVCCAHAQILSQHVVVHKTTQFLSSPMAEHMHQVGVLEHPPPVQLIIIILNMADMGHGYPIL